MSAALERLNAAIEPEARAELTRCCGSSRWVGAMLAARPFASDAELFLAAERAWTQTGPEDWREAITHHPRIGDVAQLRQRFAATAQWSSQEQQGVANAGEEVLQALAKENDAYADRFGFTFLVCATGKSAAEMLGLLKSRIGNAPEAELRIAAAEQAKITRLRLEKLLSA